MKPSPWYLTLLGMWTELMNLQKHLPEPSLILAPAVTGLEMSMQLIRNREQGAMVDQWQDDWF